MKAKFTNNMLLKIISLLAAILLWVVVVNIDDAVQEKTFRSIKVEMVNTDIITSKDQMFRIVDGTDVVDITVSARRSVLAKLKSSDFEATADMQKDLRYDSMVGIEVKYNGNYQLQDIEQSRTNVIVSIEESKSAQFKVGVQTTGEPADGLVVGAAVPERTLVQITGPASVVDKIKRVEAQIDITGITGTTTKTCYLQPMNSDGDLIDSTYLEFYGKDNTFEVTVTTLSTKLVGISFDISTAAPEGYGISAITYTPETVTIAGSKSELTSIMNLDIPAEALNPDQITGHIEQTVDISQYLKNGIQIPDEEEHEIVVTMDISPYTTQTYTVSGTAMVFANQEDGLVMDSSQISLDIPVSSLEGSGSLTSGQIQVAVDLKDCKKEGTYELPVKITLPDGYTCPDDLAVTVTLTTES